MADIENSANVNVTNFILENQERVEAVVNDLVETGQCADAVEAGNKVAIAIGNGTFEDLEWQAAFPSENVESQSAESTQTEQPGSVNNNPNEQTSNDADSIANKTFEEAYSEGNGEEWYENYTRGREHAQNYEDYAHSRGYAALSSPYTNGKYSIDFSGIGANFNTTEIKDIIGKVQRLYPLLSTVTTSIKGIASQFGTLNPDTQSKLSGSVGSGSELQSVGIKNADAWLDYVKGAETGLHTAVTVAEGNDAIGAGGDTSTEGLSDGSTTPGYDGPATPGDTGEYSDTTASSGGNGGYGGGSSSDVGSSDFSSGGGGSGGGSSGSGGGGDTGSKKKKKDSSTEEVVATAFGTLSFAAIVPFYSEIGVSSTIQSKANGTYDVVGIYCQDGKYYYKIYDKDVKKYYFVEMDKNCILTTNYKDVLKSNETSMMLKQPQLGEDILAKMTDPKEVYFMNGTTPGQGEVSGITFANVIDSTDGKNYYVPLSDSVEVLSLDTITTSASQATNTTTTTTQTVG